MAAKKPISNVYVLLHSGILRPPQMEAIRHKIHKAGNTLVILEGEAGAIPGIGSPDYRQPVTPLRNWIEQGPHRMVWPKKLDASRLQAIAVEALFQSHAFNHETHADSIDRGGFGPANHPAHPDRDAVRP